MSSAVEIVGEQKEQAQDRAPVKVRAENEGRVEFFYTNSKQYCVHMC